MAFEILDSIEQVLAPSQIAIQQFAEDPAFCGKPLYPRQVVLLKLIFLEELTGPEEDILTYWMNGGRGGNEITISPNIRERRDFLRENGYKHFREIQLVGGRRSSKGFVTGLCMAKVMWDCYDDQTEVFTDHGWKLFANVVANDRIATLTQSGQIEYHRYTDRVDKHYRGQMVSYQNGKLNFVVTPNHNMLVDQGDARWRKGFELKPMMELNGEYVVPQTAHVEYVEDDQWFRFERIPFDPISFDIWHGRRRWLEVEDQWLCENYDRANLDVVAHYLKRSLSSVYTRLSRLGLRTVTKCLPPLLSEVRLEDFARFVGFWLAEGDKTRHGHDVTISQKKECGIAWLTDLLGRLGWPYEQRTYGSDKGFRWFIKSPELQAYLLALIDGDELRLPSDALTTWGLSALRGLYEGMVMGDGNWSAQNDRFTKYHSQSRRLIDDFQALLIHIGKVPGNISISQADGWTIHICGSDRILAHFDTKDCEVFDYEGTIHCLTVPNHVMLVRRRDKSMWCGNTLQLGDPGAYYGIDKEKDIYFSCIAGSESQAKEFQYADLVSTVENCKAFEPYLVKSLETEFRVATNADLRKANAAKARGNKIMRDIAKLRGKALAANAGTLRGSATMASAIDEMAHMLPGESKASADQVYIALEPSMDQFGLDGIVFLNSSPYTKVGMFYECYEANLRPFDPAAPVTFTNPLDMDSDDIAVSNGNPRNFGFQFPSWALFEGYRKYSSKYKKKTRGKEFGKMITVSPDWDPEETDSDNDSCYSLEDRAAILQARAKEAANPEAYKVERRGKFAEVTDAYLNPSMVDQMYRGVPDGFENMPNGDLVRRFRPISTNHGDRAANLFRYKFHVDPSSTTAGFGFAIGHIEYFPDPTTGLDQEHVVFDLIKRWDPANFQGKVIRWKPILQELATYATIFRPFEITFDQHQSAEPIQDLQDILNGRNVQCRVFEKVATNELNWKRWEVFKTALYQGLIHAPFDEYPNPSPMGSGTFTSKDELKFLQQMATGGKFPRIEKQEIGPVQTKDMADCIGEVVYTLIGNLHFTTMRERLAHSALIGGAPGGYAIGQGGPVGGPGPPGISGYYSRREEKFAQQGGRESLTRGALGLSRKRRGNRSRGRW